jgi:N6-L-threonylcarbamoyladenine synthase
VSSIFAIETSCDETSAAVLNSYSVLSNIISSQAFHRMYGGIVPEMASRAQLKVINRITNEALDKANVSLNEMETVAATQGPGLIGSLLVGYNYAKSVAVSLKKNFIPVNHVEAHLYSSYIGKEKIRFPYIGLIVSGGHTILVLVKNYFEYKLLGQTIDDAAGEAFDKAAKLLGLPYPGGPEVDKLAGSGNDLFHSFPIARIKDNYYNFSFSGIKTSLLYFLRDNYCEFFLTKDSTLIPLNDVCASYQRAIVSSLVEKTLSAAKEYKVTNISVSGGVSLNSKLRSEFLNLESKGFKIFFPEQEYTTDNAAMIGFTAYLKLRYKNNLSGSGTLTEPAFARFDYSYFNT